MGVGIAAFGEGDETGIDLHEIACAQLTQCTLHFGRCPAEVAVECRDGQFFFGGGAALVVVNVAEDDLVVEAAALIAAAEHGGDEAVLGREGPGDQEEEEGHEHHGGGDGRVPTLAEAEAEEVVECGEDVAEVHEAEEVAAGEVVAGVGAGLRR